MAPSDDNDWLVAHANLLCDSFERLTGRSLIEGDTPVGRAKCLYHAPFAVVSHGLGADPIFNYANVAAQQAFGYDWEAFLALPSRLSAGPDAREARERTLLAVKDHGFLSGYSGLRVSADGSRFEIRDTTIWNVLDDDCRYHGQAALIGSWAAHHDE